MSELIVFQMNELVVVPRFPRIGLLPRSQITFGFFFLTFFGFLGL